MALLTNDSYEEDSDFMWNDNYYKSKNKRENQKIRKKFNNRKQKGQSSKITARKKCRTKKNRRNRSRIKSELDTTLMTTDYSSDCIRIQDSFESSAVCIFDYIQFCFSSVFYRANAYKLIIDDIWINYIILFLDIYDFLSLTQTCCDLNKLLTRNIIQNVYWKIKCGLLLNTSFIPSNNSDNNNAHVQSETFHQCFKPVNNDWKQFYVEIKIIYKEWDFANGDLSKQINESLFFDLIGDYEVKEYCRNASDNLPKIFLLFLCKTLDNDNKPHVINDEINNSEYKVRDIYEKKLSNIDIIHARDKNGDSLFYKCVQNGRIKVKTLKFLYEYAIKMNKQFPQKYSKHDVYYFVNNINPNILLNTNYKNSKKEEVTKKTGKLRVIPNVNRYSLINFDQFHGEYYGKRYSTFMVACKRGYCTKIKFLIDYCQWFIDLTLCGWNREEKRYCYASDLAINYNKVGFNWRYTPKVGEKLLERIKWMEVGYQDYGMKISINIMFDVLFLFLFNFCLFVLLLIN